VEGSIGDASNLLPALAADSSSFDIIGSSTTWSATNLALEASSPSAGRSRATA
jgi:hypothetical protein